LESTLVSAGVSHHTAPVQIRERLSFAGDLLSEVLHAGQASGLTEVAVLSTCNRTELVGVAARELSAEEIAVRLTSLLSRSGQLEEPLLQPLLVHRTGIATARHLCRIAAGLESMVLGEAEILGQVEQACHHAILEGTAGPTLTALFQCAVRAGRRARAETSICRKATSVISEALRLAEDHAGNLAERRLLLVGVGTAARGAGEALRARGVRRLTVVSRRHDRALRVAREWSAIAIPWSRLLPALDEADVVVSATSAPHPVITLELLSACAPRRSDQGPRLILDLAVPRDVDPAARELPGTRLFDLDDLQERIQRNHALREREVPGVEAIVEQEVLKFLSWQRSRQAAPSIVALRRRAEEIRRAELAKALRKVPGLTPEMTQAVEAFSRILVNKLLHEPTHRLANPDATGEPAQRAS